MEDWVIVDDTNSVCVPEHEAWNVDCPRDGCPGDISLTGYNPPDEITCYTCEETIQVGLRIE